MTLHRNAKLGLAGRLALVQRDRRRHEHEGRRGGLQRLAGDGAPLVASLAPSRRPARSSRSCLLDRSSRPHRSPRGCAPELQERICACRRRLAGGRGWSLARLVIRTRPSGGRSSRAGISRPPRQSSETASSYEWPCPGDLLHMDGKRYARFERPRPCASPAIVRSANAGGRDRRRGSATNGRTRSSTTTRGWPTASCTAARGRRRSLGSVERALAFYARHGIVRQAADERQRLRLRQEPLTARVARRQRHPSPEVIEP